MSGPVSSARQSWISRLQRLQDITGEAVKTASYANPGGCKSKKITTIIGFEASLGYFKNRHFAPILKIKYGLILELSLGGG